MIAGPKNPTFFNFKSPGRLYESNPIICYTLIQPGIFHGHTTDFQSVSYSEVSWGRTNRLRIMEPGTVGSWVPVNLTSELYCGAQRDGLIL